MIYKKNNFKKHNFVSKGFTIIEMIVTLAIIGILILMAVPSFQRYLHTAKDTETDVFATAINTSVIQTLFPFNNELISDFEDLNDNDGDTEPSPERDKILRLADLPEGDTIRFLYYNPNYEPTLPGSEPEIFPFAYPTDTDFTDQTWVVYIPTNNAREAALNPDGTSTFNFRLDVIVFTPQYAELRKYENSIPVDR